MEILFFPELQVSTLPIQTFYPMMTNQFQPRLNIDDEDEYLYNTTEYPQLTPLNDSSEFDRSCDSSYRNRQSSEPAQYLPPFEPTLETKAVSLSDFQDSSREINKITINRTPTAMDILQAEITAMRSSQQDWMMDDSRFRCASTPAVSKCFLSNGGNYMMMDDE
jgi:hypothetical protein